MKGNGVEVWSSSQTPVFITQNIANQLGIDVKNVTVHQIRGGGGFGRRLSNEPVFEAAAISQRIGKPVKLQWSREDDMAFITIAQRPTTAFKVLSLTASSLLENLIGLAHAMTRTPITPPVTGHLISREKSFLTSLLSKRCSSQKHPPVPGEPRSLTSMPSRSSRSLRSSPTKQA